MTHALSSIPFYRDAVSIKSMSDPHEILRRFPVLGKPDVQDSAQALRQSSLPVDKLHYSRTSGSTGEPTTTWFDRKSWLLSKYALKARRVLNAALPFRQRLLICSERADSTDTTLANLSIARAFFAARNLNVDDPISENAKFLRRFQPTMIYGYPSYLAHLGELARLESNSLSVPIVFTSSEMVGPPERNYLGQLFRGRIIDVYGSTEFKEMAVQCEFGRYHINFESVFIESVPDQHTDQPRVLVTTLVNKAMPLIRYDIGDHAEFSSGKCDCGREGPTLLQPHGRVAELLHFPNGKAITPFVLTTAIGAYAEIKNYTIVHEAPDSIRLKFFAEPMLNTERSRSLKEDVAAKLPDGIRITLDSLDQRLPVGKRVTVSRTF